ncbi:MAG: metallophosphoesterase, partial [Muribaculaceae bacterium]|nr:metallophosphoesterase [Muribaculaceae bacterium]
MKRLSLAVVVMFVSLAALCQEKTIFVMSDIHVMAPELLVNDGEAFQKYIASDPKLLRKSSEVLNALVDTIRKYQPDLVLIPGDLTKDGELVSHRLVAETLGKIRDEGIPILLVPGNHDIDNPEGVYYDGSATRYAERTPPAVFAELYKDFGYGDDAVRDENSLSWVAEPFDGLVIIGIDTNWYEK